MVGTREEVTQAAAAADGDSGRVGAVRAHAREAPRALFISYPAADCGWVNSFNSALTPQLPRADGDRAEHHGSAEEPLTLLASRASRMKELVS